VATDAISRSVQCSADGCERKVIYWLALTVKGIMFFESNGDEFCISRFCVLCLTRVFVFLIVYVCVLLFVLYGKFCSTCLQCFDTVGWASGRASGV